MMPVEDSSAMFAQQHNSQNMAPSLWDQPERKEERLTHYKIHMDFPATTVQWHKLPEFMMSNTGPFIADG